MASFGFKDFTESNDLLKRHGMKPWWESWREDFLIGSMAAALFMMYAVTPGQETFCLPMSKNGTIDQDGFGEAQVHVINTYCLGQIPWFAGNIGFISFMLSLVLLFISKVWLRVPEVVNAFRTFAKAEHIFHDLKQRLTIKELKVMAVRPEYRGSKDVREVRRACLLLWRHSGWITKCYRIRNLVLLAATLGSLAFTSFVTVSTFQIKNAYFHCSLPHDVLVKLEFSLPRYETFFCSYGIPRKIIAPLVIFVLALTVQTFLIFAGGCAMMKKKVVASAQDFSSDQFKDARKFANLMSTFWKNSCPVGHGDIEDFVTYIFSTDALYTMYNFLPEVVKNLSIGSGQDEEYFKLVSRMQVNGGNKVVKLLYGIYMDQRNAGNLVHPNIHKALLSCRFYKWDDYGKKFAKILAKHRRWQLLLDLLNSAQDEKCPVEEFELNTLADDPKEANCGCSLLYYALRMSRNTEKFNCTAVTTILKSTSNQRRYVHFEGKTVPAENFLTQQCKRNPTFSVQKINELFQLLKETKDVSTTDALVEANLEKIYEDYEKATGKFEIRSLTPKASVADFSTSYEMFARRVARYKFWDWTETTRRYAFRALEMSHWGILVNLLNGLILEESLDGPQGQMIAMKTEWKAKLTSCGLQQFNAATKDIKNRNIFHYTKHLPRSKRRGIEQYLKSCHCRHNVRLQNGTQRAVDSTTSSVTNPGTALKQQHLKERTQNAAIAEEAERHNKQNQRETTPASGRSQRGKPQTGTSRLSELGAELDMNLAILYDSDVDTAVPKVLSGDRQEQQTFTNAAQESNDSLVASSGLGTNRDSAGDTKAFAPADVHALISALQEPGSESVDDTTLMYENETIPLLNWCEIGKQ